jgi:hypothetical protein
LTKRRIKTAAGEPFVSQPVHNWLDCVFLNTWHPYAWIAGIVCLLYGITVTYPFIFDDIQLVYNNYHLLKDPGNIFKAFTLDVFWKTPGAYYRPLLTVSLMLDVLLGGQQTSWFHASNILLHSACAVLVFTLLLRLQCPRALAFFLGILFAVHPVQAQAVAWVAGRNDSLMALFTMLSLLAFMRFTQCGRWRYYAAHCLLLLLALLSKESALVLPLLICWYYVFVTGHKPSRASVTVVVGCQMLIIAVYLSLRWNALGGGFYPQQFNSVPENVAGFFGYIGKLLFPFGLSTLPTPESVSPLWGPLAVILFGALFVFGRIANRRLFVFGCGWFVLFLVPTIARSTDFANYLEHRLYLPLTGLLIMLASSHFLRNHLRPSGKVFMVAAVPVVLFCAATVHHVPVFASNSAFWKNAEETSPSCYFPCYMLGKMTDYNINPTRAVQYLQRSLALASNRLAYNELGHLYEKTGENSKAVATYRAGIERFPDDATLLDDLWFHYHRMRSYGRAITLLTQKMVVTQTNPDLLYHLGLSYFEIDSLDRAAHYFKQTLAANPNHAQSYERLSLIAYRNNDFASAITCYDKAVANGFQRTDEIEKALAPYR